ncbi:MAG TPA: polysaccharide biosynthesis protein [Candidatus Eisenbergiella merdavium]|uniref:Polysaccharide biosynthesis protein n=1 Tax=Candidatus Eisenbergiella merdavium TaxID=2838551 RepID=A0A9D2NID1_9FIRM|nr:polysaccharide biosynthesis protein [Candidatus Eisenbergiella merdavium]
MLHSHRKNPLPVRSSPLLQRLKNPFIAGTLVLTATGLVSRLVGFFYRIFLSRLFGEENIGIYQLISPVLSLVFSFSAAGIQNAVSKFAAGKELDADGRGSARVLFVGLLFSLPSSLFCTAAIFCGSDFIAARLLFEPRCAPLLRIAALSFPFSAVHSCINGYFYGLRRASVPASAQLAEQFVRVGSVYLISAAALQSGRELSVSVAAAGMVIGEMGSMLLTIGAVRIHFSRAGRSGAVRIGNGRFTGEHFTSSLSSLAGQMLSFSAPLCLNRLCINILQAIEAACIPAKLQVYGYSVSESLSVYGVLTGMALPLIFFPGTLTNSVSVLLMPAISEADSANNHRMIGRTVRKCILYCLLLGISCSFLFLCAGELVGTLLFDSPLAGQLIVMMGFLCPFLYLNTTLTSILHGLGRTGYTFGLSMASLLLRLLFVFHAIPVYGMKGYLTGMLLGQLVTTLFSLIPLKRYCLPG